MPAKTRTPENPPAADSWASTAADWRGRGIHRAELWSGARILFRFLTLGEMITKGALPHQLLELAALEYAEPGAGPRAIAEAFTGLSETSSEDEIQAADTTAQEIGRNLAALNRELCAAALVEPKLTADDLAHPDFPIQDLEMLAGFLTRQLQFDAAGRRIGVEPLDTFATFRNEHGCAPDCPQCEQARRQLSSPHLGAV